MSKEKGAPYVLSAELDDNKWRCQRVKVYIDPDRLEDNNSISSKELDIIYEELSGMIDVEDVCEIYPCVIHEDGRRVYFGCVRVELIEGEEDE